MEQYATGIKVVRCVMINRELLSCEDCVFCISFYCDWSVPPTNRFLCNLGLDTKFHVRNGYEDMNIGCKIINSNPTTPCKARYTNDEIRKILGV